MAWVLLAVHPWSFTWAEKMRLIDTVDLRALGEQKWVILERGLDTVPKSSLSEAILVVN